MNAVKKIAIVFAIFAVVLLLGSGSASASSAGSGGQKLATSGSYDYMTVYKSGDSSILAPYNRHESGLASSFCVWTAGVRNIITIQELPTAVCLYAYYGVGDRADAQTRASTGGK